MPVCRAQYDDDTVVNTLITNINMDSAAVRNTGQGKSVFVEECRCPAGYTGLSCEVSFSSSLKLYKILCSLQLLIFPFFSILWFVFLCDNRNVLFNVLLLQLCAPGYNRHQSGPWLGLCSKDREPCRPGTYGDPPRIPCEACPCPLTNPGNQ